MQTHQEPLGKVISMFRSVVFQFLKVVQAYLIGKLKPLGQLTPGNNKCLCEKEGQYEQIKKRGFDFFISFKVFNVDVLENLPKLIIYIQDDQKCLVRLRGKQRDSETSTSNDINVGMKECRT